MGLLVESVLGGLLLTLETKDATRGGQVGSFINLALFKRTVVLEGCASTSTAKSATSWATTVIALSFNRSNGCILAVSVVILGHCLNYNYNKSSSGIKAYYSKTQLVN